MPEETNNIQPNANPEAKPVLPEAPTAKPVLPEAPAAKPVLPEAPAACIPILQKISFVFFKGVVY
mgnify:CR=1 FL=1